RRPYGRRWARPQRLTGAILIAGATMCRRRRSGRRLRGRAPGALTEIAVGDGAGGARSEGGRAGARLLHLGGRQLRFDRGGARGRVGVALVGGDRKPEQRFHRIGLHAATLLIEDAQIVLTVANAQFGGLPEPAESGAFVKRGAVAARVIDAEIVH